MEGNTLTIVGNLTADPETRVTPSGVPVTNFRIAQSQRRFDKQAQEWVDLDPLFISGAIWRDYGVHFANSAKKGDQIIVVGRLTPNVWEKDGETRHDIQLEVDHVGFTPRFADITVTKRAAGSARPQAAAPAPQQGATAQQFAAPAPQQAAPAQPVAQAPVTTTDGF